jgi:hypothetical protein
MLDSCKPYPCDSYQVDLFCAVGYIRNCANHPLGSYQVRGVRYVLITRRLFSKTVL